MVLLNCEIIEVSDVINFVKTFKMKKEFRKKYGIDIEDVYDKDKGVGLSDGEIIEELLKERKENYIVEYIDENNGYFNIFRIKTKKEQVIEEL